METIYNKAKTWELILFSTKNLVTSAMVLLMLFASYLATGSYGILVSTAGLVLSAARVFDGVVDPIIAFIIDKTDSRFGRYRPLVILGYLTMAASIVLLFFVGINNGNMITFILLYLIYVFGYSLYGNAANAAMASLTNVPMQRAIIGRWSGILSVVLSTLYGSVYTASYLLPKYGSLSLPLLQEMSITALIIAGIATLLVCIAISRTDKPEFYEGTDDEKVSIKDMINVLKGNKPLFLITSAGSFNKLTLQAAANSAIVVMVWGIIVGDYGFRSNLALYTFIPTVLMIYFGLGFAGKKYGLKNAVIYSCWGAFITAAIQLIIFIVAPTQIATNFGVMLLFLAAYVLNSGFKQVFTSSVQPMIADVADYELYRTGKFMSGTVTSLYGLVDNIVSSLANVVVSFLISMIGFRTVLPQVTDANTPQIFWVGMFVFLILPMISYLYAIIAMKFYELSPDRMKEIQQAIHSRREAGKTVLEEGK